MSKKLGTLKKKLFVAVAILAATVAGSGRAYADPYPVFTFDPCVFDATICGDQGADRISGTYYENLTLDGSGGFTVDGFVLFQVIQDENDLGIDASVSGLTASYDLYATFTAEGTYAVQPGTSIVVFSVSDASGQILADDPINNTYDTNPTGGYAILSGTGDDQLLATGVFASGSGISCGQPTCPNPTGSFSLTFNPVRLTDSGTVCSGDGVSAGTGPGCDFFTSPRPFYIEANLSGQFIEPNILTAQTTTGTADLIFEGAAVPEPATLTLLGLGLAGVARRRVLAQRKSA